jgi:ATP synthase I chain.
MDDFPSLVRAGYRISIFFLSFCLLGWALADTGGQRWFAGLALGTVVSVINGRYLAMKVDLLAKAAVERTARRINLGFVTRASMALLAVVAAVKFADRFELMAVMAGLFFTPLATLAAGVALHISGRKRG